MALLLNAAIGISLLCVPSLGGSSLPSSSAPVLPPSLAFLPRGGQSPPRPKGSGEQRSIVLVIDVDNCLYSEAEARSASADLLGVEEQIIRNSNAFCESHHNLTADQSQDLYLEYGSTIEGLRRTRATDDIQEIRGMLRSYYNEVYDGIDTSCLLSHRRMGVDEGSTGYSHVRSSKRGQYLANVLKTVPCPLYFASNSPRGHVLKVLTALGLRGVPVEGILTPDTVYEGGEGDGGVEPYPTKSSPDLFYRRILDSHPEARIILLDDSRTNVDKASTVGIDGLQVTADFPLEKALAAAMGHISFPFGSQSTGGEKGESNPYEFSDVKYLKSKNLVDAAAINLEVWQRLAKELKDSVVPSLEDGVLRIADVGAGLLSMLRLMVQGGSGKASLFDELQSSDGKFPDGLKQIHYYAYESNTNLVEGCKDTMTDLGFTEVAEFVVGGRPEEIIFRGQLGGSLDDDASNLSVTVHLRTKDFVAEDSRNFQAPNLVVGCCFADLFDPHDLAQSLISFTRLCRHGGGCDGKHSSGPLVYFPITFSGTTRFNPAMPFETCSRIRPIPSDTRGFQLYSKSLSENLGHNLDTNRLIEAMEDHGGNLISRGPADWLIDPSKHRYLWETMIYFFGTCGAAEQMIEKWNSTEWLSRARKLQPCIQVSNIDLLFQLEPSSISKTSLHLGAAEEATVGRASEVQEIEFQSPRKVGITTKGMRSVGPNQVEVTSAASLISSGTELKIFNGMFEEAALDVNIKGMADDSMAYPLSYGYSLVGKVTKCGSEVADADELLGRLVFAFSPVSTPSMTVPLIVGVFVVCGQIMIDVFDSILILSSAAPRILIAFIPRCG